LAALHWIRAPQYTQSSESLSIFRLLFATTYLALRTPKFQWVAGFPDVFFNPPVGVTAVFFAGFPPRLFFVVLDSAIVLALMFLICGRRVQMASVVLVGSQLLGNCWAYAFGKIDYDILAVIAPLFLLAAGWDGRPRLQNGALSLFAFVIALSMFTAAFQKVASGWLEWSTQATLGNLVRNIVALEKGEWPIFSLVVEKLPRFAWETMDYSTVILEASFLVAFLKPRWFKATCSVACLFHLGIALMMRLVFISNLAAYGAFVKWDSMADHLRVRVSTRRLQMWLSNRTDAEVILVAAIFAVTTLLWANPVNLLLVATVPGGPSFALLLIASIGSGVSLLSSVSGRLRWSRSGDDVAPTPTPEAGASQGIRSR
jgi:hypothetical protein